jgi:hypothetical protein
VLIGRRAVAGTGAALLILVACAKIEAPPGAAPDVAPPRLIGVSPESLAVLPGFAGDVTFRFDEVISEGSSPSQGTGTGDLERLIILSPTTRPPEVRWRRDHITVRPREGWVANRVYRVQLLPGIVDLRNNRQTEGGTVLTFTTGATRPTLTLTGSAQDWVGGHAAAGALVEAVRVPDSLVYRTLADSSGAFALGPIPDGPYLVFATLDQNRNMVRDAREAFDSIRVTATQSAVGTLWAFPHDTVGPRIQTITMNDSASASISFSQPLDPAQRLTAAAVSVRILPDSAAVRVVSILPPAADDSAFGRRPADTTGRRADTTARAVTRAADTTRRRIPADSARGPARPTLGTRLVLRIAGRWTPGARYVVGVRGVRNVNGVAADASAGLAIPAAPAAAPRSLPHDSTAAPRDSTGAPRPVPADSGVRRTKPR